MGEGTVVKAGVLVVAKAPVAGLAKTRLGADVGYDAAAELAAEALLDTLDVCESTFPPDRRVLALTGSLASASHGAELRRRLRAWTVTAQRGSTFAERLKFAHLDAAAVIAGPVVQIGTDTPQLEPALLRQIAELLDNGACDAVLGPAVDGGWWALGLTDPALAGGLGAVPMSTSSTGAATRRMLAAGGASVATVAALRDVDTAADAAAASVAAPHTRFSRRWRGVDLVRRSVAELFDEALAGAPCLVHGLPDGPVELPVSLWSGRCDETDAEMLDACSGATLDVGCGPGRLTYELSQRGHVALGIDIAPRAVRQTRDRGAHALRRDVFDPLPAEGRWQSVLLADGNIGIGGDPLRLLRRVHDLLAPVGSAVVEVARAGTSSAAHDVHLQVGSRISHPFRWAVLGPEALCELARQASFRMLGVRVNRGRVFVRLGKGAAR